MNNPIHLEPNFAANAMESDERWQAAQQVLASPAFLKAPRMRAILSFLMLRKLSGMEESISEYAIGIEVFRRDARDYDTTIDPVVRVQMGRLRDRLAQYYATAGSASGLQITIPVGTYVPVVAPVLTARPMSTRTIELAPLRSLTPSSAADSFISGLEDELALRLFQRFGGEAGSVPDHYRIEVSVRTEHRHARATVRLIRACTGQIDSMLQCDGYGDMGMDLQEELAMAICNDLQKHLFGTNSSAVAGPC